VTAHKLNQSWETLQEALDELGHHGWDLCTTIYSATSWLTDKSEACPHTLLRSVYTLFGTTVFQGG
jgi:hypothetical protein